MKRRHHPLVTVLRPAWKSLVMLSLAVDRERYGLLFGRITPFGVRVAEAVEVPNTMSKQYRVRVDLQEEARALGVAEWVLELDMVGSWHSHCHKICSSDAIMPQISEIDEKTMVPGEAELICSTFKSPGSEWKSHDSLCLCTQVARMICKAEAWMKVSKKVVPCELKLR